MTIERFESLFNKINDMFKGTDAYKRKLSGESFSPLYFDLTNTSFEEDGITGILKDIVSYRIFCNLSLFVDNSEDCFQNCNDMISIVGRNMITFDIESIDNIDKNIFLNLGNIWKTAQIESDCKLDNYKFNIFIQNSDELELLSNLKELSNISLIANNLTVTNEDLKILLCNNQYLELNHLDFNLEIQDVKNSDNILNEFIYDYFKHIKTKHLNMNLNAKSISDRKQIEKLFKKHLSTLNTCDILITDRVENDINLNLSFSDTLDIDLEKIQDMFKEYYIIKGDIESVRSKEVC